MTALNGDSGSMRRESILRGNYDAERAGANVAEVVVSLRDNKRYAGRGSRAGDIHLALDKRV